MSRSHRFPPVVLISSILIFSLLLVVAMAQIFRAGPGGGFLPSAQAPEAAVQRAWRLAQQSGQYHFTTRIEQTTHPAASLANVGQTGQVQALYMEGEADLPAQTLLMRLWQDGGRLTDAQSGVEVRLEGEQAYGRETGGEWQELSGFSGSLAPGNDMVAYLAGARNVRVMDEQAVTNLPRYAFNLHMPTLADFIRDQLEDSLRQQGKLPVGLHLDTPNQYRDALGDGEVWLDGDGLPRRLSVHIAYPQQANGERVEVQIVTDFSAFNRRAIAASVRGAPGAWIAGQLSSLRSALFSTQGGLALAGLGLVLLLFVQSHSKKVYAALALNLVVAMIFTPLLQGYQAQAFYREINARRAGDAEIVGHGDAETQDVGDVEAQGYDLSMSPHLSISASLLQSDEPDPASDEDGDGLTYAHEEALGTNPSEVDSDGDGISDDVEIAGFAYNGELWYTNPLDPDTNNDSLPDGSECPEQVPENADTLSPHGVCRDSDGDGTPDVFDRDDDGDGVPDRVDLSPYSQVDADGSPFSQEQPLQLQVNQLQADTPAFVDFQLRPEDDDHLWYALNVLDWPSGDEQGQIQRKTGNDSTFADVEGGDSGVSNSDNGDMRLVPMLEIEIPYQEGHYGNLPVKAGAPITRTLDTPLEDWLDAEKLDPFGISVREMNDAGDLLAYVPLNLVPDENGDDRVAFTARMAYWPAGSGSEGSNWGSTQQVRMLWGVQMLTDLCETSEGEDECTWKLDQVQIVHTYTDTWRLTGLAVTEDHGAKAAIVYEDPGQEPDDAARQYDDWLWALANGLDATFITGRDCDTLDANDQCVADGARDLTIDEIHHRWDNSSNAGTTDEERWSIPITATQVITYAYEHEGYLAHIAMTETQKILDDTFTPWVAAGADSPTLLFAIENTQRTANLDISETYSQDGAQVKMDLSGPVAPLEVYASIRWAPYRYQDGEWQSYPIDEYWDKLSVRLKAVFGSDYADDPDFENILNGQVLLAQTFYLSLYRGTSGLVQQDDTILTPNLPEQSDGTRVEFLNDFKVDQIGGIMSRTTYSLANLLAKAYKAGESAVGKAAPPIVKLFGGIGKLLQGGKDAGLSKLSSWWGKSLFGRLKSVAIGVLGLATLATLVAVVVLASTNRFQEAALALMAVNTLAAVADTVITITKVSKLLTSAGNSLRTAMAKAPTKYSGSCAAVGLIIAVAVTWGVFFYLVKSEGVKFGSMAFDALAAQAIASTITAVILLAIAAIPIIGQIIATLIFLIDSITALVCAVTDSDNSFCIGISGWITQGIAWFIYGGHIMVTVDDDDRLKVTGLDRKLVEPSLGFSTGNRLVFTVDLKNKLDLIDPWDDTHDWKAAAFSWQYDDDALASSTFAYALQSSQKDLHESLERDQISGKWDRSGGRPFVLTARASNTSAPLQAGINRPTDLYLAEGFAIPSQECWVGWVPGTPIFFPVCYLRTEKNTNHVDLGKSLQLDVFPATLDAFYALVDKDGGYALGWSQNTNLSFPRLKDADGDGLRDQLDGGADPNDRNPDSDSDGLSDYTEIELGSDPGDADTDNDGLTDYEEAIHYTNPLLTDSDFDGLTDKEELDGWEFVYGFAADGSQLSAWVTSDPLQADADADELTDFQEKTFGFNPNVPSDPNVLTFQSEVREHSAPRLLLPLDETAGAKAFRDVSGDGNGVACQGETCPASGHAGRYLNALHFDGLDDYAEATLAGGRAFQQLTLAAWVKLDTLPGRVMRFITLENEQAALRYDGSGSGGPGQLHFYVRLGGALRSLRVNNVLQSGAWQHVAGAFDGSTLRLYLNGVLIGSQSASGSPGEITGARLSHPGETLEGFLDEAAVFDTALSASQLQELMAGRYNPGDLSVRPGEALDYQASVKNELYGRYAQGLLDVDFPASTDELAPETFVLNPQEQVTMTGQTSVGAVSSGVYRLTQKADAFITDWRDESDYAELLLHFAESAPPFEDSSGSQPPRDGDCSAPHCPTATSGSYGNALLFDGVDDYVAANKVVEYLGGEALTFGAWVYPDASQSGNGTILAFNTASGGNRNMLGYVGSSHQFYYYDDKVGRVYSASAFDPGQWYQVMAVIDADNHGHLYVNGVEGASFTTAARPDSKGKFSVGQEWDGGAASEHFKGKIDEAVIFDRALSAASVQAHYGRPVFDLPLDEAAGSTTFKDQSGFGNDAACEGGGHCQPTPVEGAIGQAMLFDGVDTLHVQSSDSLDLSGGNFSLSTWVYPTGGPANSSCPFKAEYWNYRNPGWEKILTRCEETAFDYDWGSGSPDPVVNRDDFFVVWTGDYYFDGGNYTFNTRHDDVIVVDLDGNTIFKNYSVGNDRFTTYIPKGKHRLQIYYEEYSGLAYVSFNWSRGAAYEDQWIMGNANYPAIERVNNNELRISYMTSSGPTRYTTEADALRTYRWNHVAAVYNGTTYKLYVNGVEVGEIAAPGVPVSPDHFDIGLGLHGGLDQLAIYKYALDAGQVGDLYEAGAMALNMPLDDPPGSTVFADALGGPGAVCQAPACPTSGVPGRENYALRFDGVDDVARVNDAHTGDLQDLTVAAWVKPDTLPARVMRFVTLSGEKAVLRYDGSTHGGPGELHFYMKIDGVLRHMRVDNVLQAGVWQHVAGTYDGQEMKLYLNGQQVGSSLPISGTLGSEQGVMLSNSGAEVFDGSLDEVRLYRRALNAGEIQQLYLDAPQLLLTLDESEGATTFEDSSGGGHDGACSAGRCPTAGLKGQVGQAAGFDGVNDAINVPDASSLMPDQALTLAAWVKLADAGVDQKIAGKSNTSSGFILGIEDGQLYPEVWDNQGTRYTAHWGNVASGYWTHLAITWESGGDLVGYINGEEAGRIAASSRPIGSNTLPLRVGIAPWNASSFPANGRIDHVTLYQRALSSAELRALFRLQAKWVEERQSTEITVDTAPPTSALASDDRYRPNQEAVLLVTASDVQTAVNMVEVGVSTDGGASYTWKAAPPCQDASGDAAWCPTFTPTIGEGRYLLQTRATDITGNRETPAQTYTLLVDDTPPSASAFTVEGQIVDPLRQGGSTWLAPLSGHAADPALSSGDPGSGVTGLSVRLYGSEMLTDTLPIEASLSVSAQGGVDWQADYPISIADPTGSYVVEVQSVDSVGNRSALQTLGTVGLDAAPPSASLDEPSTTITDTIPFTLTLTGRITETTDARAGVGGVKIRFVPAAMASLEDTAAIWHMEENNGANSFASDTGLSAICEGDACPTQTEGVWGRGQEFDGADDDLVADAVSEFITGEHGFSFGAWIKIGDKPYGGPHHAILAFNAADGSMRNQIRYDPSAERFYYKDGQADVPISYLPEQFGYYVMITIDAEGNGVFYVNGDAVKQFHSSVLPDPDGKFSIGRDWNGGVPGNYFKGVIDEITIYNRSLTPAEVRVLEAEATLSASGAGVDAASWEYSLPAELDGLYQVDLLPYDVFDNQADRSDWHKWSGAIDTSAPQVSMTADEVVSYLSVKTVYTCQATDFNLVETSSEHPAYNFKCPCQTIAPRSTVKTRAYFHETSPWYATVFTDTNRLYTYEETCTVWGFTLPGSNMKACDAFGHCATAEVSSSSLSLMSAASAGETETPTPAASLTPTPTPTLPATETETPAPTASDTPTPTPTLPAAEMETSAPTASDTPVLTPTLPLAETGTLAADLAQQEGLAGAAAGVETPTPTPTLPMADLDAFTPPAGDTPALASTLPVTDTGAPITPTLTPTLSITGAETPTPLVSDTPVLTSTLPVTNTETPGAPTFTPTLSITETETPTPLVSDTPTPEPTASTEAPTPTVVRQAQSQASADVAIDSQVLTPTVNTVLTSLPITIQGEAYAQADLTSIVVYVDDVPLDPVTATLGVTQTGFSVDWSPVTEGSHVLKSIAQDQNGQFQPEAHPVEVFVDLTPPDVDVDPLVITTTHRLSQGRVSLGGHAADLNAVDSVEVQIDGGGWQPAALSGSQWRYEWYVGEEPAGETYDVSARAADMGGHTTTVTQTVSVDLQTPSPISLTLTSAGEVITPGLTLRELPATLNLSWTPTETRTDLSYRVDWTVQTTQTAQASYAVPYTGPYQSAYLAGEAQRITPSVTSIFASGNRRVDTYGPVYVDTPLTPDYILFPSDGGEAGGESPYLGWMDSGCSLVGVDRRVAQNASGGSALDEPQSFYVTWDDQALRLAWTGADWDYQGDLFIYLDTASGGASQAYDPFGGAGGVLNFPSGTFGADALIWVSDSQTAQLLTWDGAGWQTASLSEAEYRFTPGLDHGHTDLYLPFTRLGIDNPAVASLGLAAFATEEGALQLWAAMPAYNPLNSGLVTPNDLYAGLGYTFGLTQIYFWPSLGAGVCPNSPTGLIPLYRDSDLRFGLTVEPAGSAVSFLGSDLFWLWDELIANPSATNHSQAFDFMDVDHRPVGDGDWITYTLTFANQGSYTATNVIVDATATFALQLEGSNPLAIHLDLGTLAPGQSGSRTFRGRVSLAAAEQACLIYPDTCETFRHWAGVQALVHDDAHGTGINPLEWLWAENPVDSDPPQDFGILLPETFLSPGQNLISGYAHDASGVPVIFIEAQGGGTVECSDPTPEDGSWTCAWNAGAPADGTVVSLRLKAVDSHGLESDWGDWQTFVVDSIPPQAAFSAETTEAYSDTLVSAFALNFTGVITDNHAAGSLEACLNGPCEPGVVLAEGSETTGWSYNTGSLGEHDGKAYTLEVYASDLAGNRASQPLTLGFTLDNVSPVITLTDQVERAILPLDGAPIRVLEGAASDGGGVRQIYALVKGPSGSVQSRQAGFDGGDWWLDLEADAPGSYTLWVNADDTAGNTASLGPLVVNLVQLAAGSDGPTPLGASTTLTATLKGDTGYGFTWNFGDGVTSVETQSATVQHRYPATGVYTATVTARNGTFTLLATTGVVVDEAIRGLIALNDSPTALGSPTHLTSMLGAGSNVSYLWDLGDGAALSGAAATHTYTQTGTYTATLTAWNSVSVVTATTTLLVTETPLSVANLQLHKLASDAQVRVGEQLTYTLVVWNGGPLAATQVTLTDTLPVGNVAGKLTTSQGQCNLESGKVVCTLGKLSPSTLATITLVVQVAPEAPDRITNSAVARAKEPDPLPSDNTASVTVTVLSTYNKYYLPLICR